MLELSLHIDAAAMVSNALSNGLFQRFSTLPGPKAGCMGQGFTAFQAGLVARLSRRSSC
jgi:hypothetical protein